MRITPKAHEAPQWTRILDLATEDALLFLMDEYKSMLQTNPPAWALRWLEERVADLTDEYGARQIEQQLPF